MLTRFYVIVLLFVGVGILWIEYGRQDSSETESAAASVDVEEDADTAAEAAPEAIGSDEEAGVVAEDGVSSEDTQLVEEEPAEQAVSEDIALAQDDVIEAEDNAATEGNPVVEGDVVGTVEGAAALESEDTVLASGAWTEKNYSADGNWRVIQEGEERYVELDATFATESAPDLKLFLSPTDLEDLNNQNATTESVLISPLVSNQGAQRYLIPEDVSLDEFKSLVIHCEQFSKVWSGASLP